MNKKEPEHKDLLDSELEELEREMAPFLREYHVEYPSDPEIEAAIGTVRSSYVPMKKKRSRLLYEKMLSLLQRSGREFSQISLFFWISNSLFFLLGLIAILAGPLDPYMTVMFLAPIPLILGLVEILKSRNEGMAELEMTTKHSLQEIMLSKMVIVGSFNLLLNVLVTLILPSFTEGIWLWKLILYWMTPFTVVSAIAFVVASKSRNGYATMGVTMVIWVAISSGIIISQQINLWLESVHVLYYIALNILAVTVLTLQIYRFKRRGVSFEFNH